MIRPFPTCSPSLHEATGAARDLALARAPQAEWGLAHQGARVLLSRDQASGWLVRAAGRHLVALGLPLGRPDLTGLSWAAAKGARLPLLYKCDGRTAGSARKAGWSVVRLGHEAVLDLQGWTADRPACRQLRRKLRAAAGLRIEEARELPLDRMEEVARDWALRHGGERGFSMGRFDPALLRRQRVVLARAEGELVGFASFHAAREEWTLDLMRQVEGAPDGTMHRIVAEAVALARAAGAERLSLAAVPGLESRPRLGRIAAGAPGLGQFKRAFGPRLAPRYAAAPGPASLALGLTAVGWAVHRPGPLAIGGRIEPCPAPPSARPSRLGPKIGFEPVPVPCDARPTQFRSATALPPGRPALHQRP